MLVHSFLFLAYVKMSYGAICNQKYLEFSENYDIGITPERRPLKNQFSYVIFHKFCFSLSKY